MDNLLYDHLLKPFLFILLIISSVALNLHLFISGMRFSFFRFDSWLRFFFYPHPLIRFTSDSNELFYSFSVVSTNFFSFQPVIQDFLFWNFFSCFFRIFRFSGFFFNLYFCFQIWFRSVNQILRPFVSFSGFSFSEIFDPFFRFFFFPEISVLNMALKGFSFYKTDFVQLFSSGKVFMIFLFYHLFFFRLMFTLDFVFLDSGS